MNTAALADKVKDAKAKATVGSCCVGGVMLVLCCAGMSVGWAGFLYLTTWALAAGWRAGWGG